MNHRLEQQVNELMSQPGNQLPGGAVDLGALANADTRRLKRVPIFAGLLFQMIAHGEKTFTFAGFPEGAQLVGVSIEIAEQGPQFVLVLQHPDWPAIMPGVEVPYHMVSIRSYPAPSAEHGPPAAGEGATSPDPAPGLNEEA